MDPLLIDGESLSPDHVDEVAFERRRVALHPDAARKMSNRAQ